MNGEVVQKSSKLSQRILLMAPLKLFVISASFLLTPVFSSCYQITKEEQLEPFIIIYLSSKIAQILGQFLIFETIFKYEIFPK